MLLFTLNKPSKFDDYGKVDVSNEKSTELKRFTIIVISKNSFRLLFVSDIFSAR